MERVTTSRFARARAAKVASKVGILIMGAWLRGRGEDHVGLRRVEG